MSHTGNGGHGPRTVALVGPYASGKTTLLESILAVTGATTRKGSIAQGNTVGDSSPQARARVMSTELNVATTQFMGDAYTFLDCPGSIEFLQETLNVLPAVDVAVVVMEPDEHKTQMAQPVLKFLEDMGVPHFVFVNKIDKAHGRLRDLLTLLQPVSQKPLVLRQIPIWSNGIVTGFIDLALERAFVYREHAASEVVEIPGDLMEREREARFQMLEKLADYDDHLMEELLSDVAPPRDEVFADLNRELKEGLIVPVLFGSAERDNGVRRLLKALRHDGPSVAATAARLGAAQNGEAVVQVVKTLYGDGGKMSVARVLAGEIKDGATVTASSGAAARVAGVFSIRGASVEKRGAAVTGDLALGAAALFALSLGMGAPLLAIGASAGHWLPHAGHWMERIKAVFGVALLAVALWLLERILPAAATMVLWATLLIVTATYMGALQPAVHGAPAWRTLVKGLGLVLLIYGILLLVGVAAGGRDPWQPLRGVGLVANAAGTAQPPSFRRVKTVADVDRALRDAGGRPVMLDFYADWCVTCKEMERFTFSDPKVRAEMAQMVLLQVDVTKNTPEDQRLLKRFRLFGPPGIVFFDRGGREIPGLRVIGFQRADKFLQSLALARGS